MGAISENGYGITSQLGKNKSAHRVAFEFEYGSIPKGAFILHHCDDPLCVNPDHLFLGDHKTNMRDAANKKRLRFGDSHHNSKLTSEQVQEIRRLINDPTLTKASIAKRYSVDPKSIDNIESGTTYAWVT